MAKANFDKCYIRCYNISTIQKGGIIMEFSEEVKIARKKVHFSQEDMAHQLGVSFATVNRWEGGKTKPSKLAIRAFEEFCKENSILLNQDGSPEESDNV